MKQMKNKNKCEDLFKHTVIDPEKGLRMNPKLTEEQYVEVKI